MNDSELHDLLVVHATRLAITTQDRQLAVIARAYLAGDQRRAEALARDHLVDQPDEPIARWIVDGAGGEHPR